MVCSLLLEGGPVDGLLEVSYLALHFFKVKGMGWTVLVPHIQTTSIRLGRAPWV